jgi:S-DNA-T family DNA segregation ATPase FtsK/SpoIIIE
MRLFGNLKKEHWNELLGILLIILSIWMLISLMGYGGKVGDRIMMGLNYLIGYTSYLFTILIAYWGISLFRTSKVGILSGLFGSICLLISGLLFLGLFFQLQQTLGVIGSYLDNICVRWIGKPGLFLSWLVFFILGIVLVSELTFRTIFHTLYIGFKKIFPKPEKTKKSGKEKKDRIGKPSKKSSTITSETPVIILDSSGKKAEDEMYLKSPSIAAPYVVPPLSLLDRPKQDDEELTKDVLQETARILERSFGEFGIDARVLRVNRGPVITRYEVEPGPGVKVNKFVNLSDDLTLVLRATRVRVVAPVPGEGVIGIEVPNERIAQVGLREVLESQEFGNTKSKIPMPLGKDI